MKALDTLFSKTVERVKLPNGLTILIEPDPSSRLFEAQIWVKTGSIHEGNLLGCGLSHYLEHMLFKGTSRRSAKELTREVHGLGGQINAYTSFERTVYYIQGPTESLKPLLALLADLVWDAVIPEEECEKERDVILREIDMGLDEPDVQVAQMLLSTAYQYHPYRYPVIGHRPLFETLTRDELLRYYDARYGPNNVVLAIAGDVEVADCLRKMEAAWGSIAMRRVETPFLAEELLQLAERRYYQTGPYAIVRGALGFQIPGMRAADAPGIDTLAHILGQGRSSILWRRLRDAQRHVHGIEATAWNPGTSGLFWISYTCDPGKREAVEAAIEAEIQTLIKEGISKNLLQKTIQQAIVDEIDSRKTVSGQASRLGFSEVVLGDLGYNRRYLKRLTTLTVTDIVRVAQTYLVNHRLSRVSLEPDKATKPTLVVDKKQKKGPSAPSFESTTLPNRVRLLLYPCSKLPKIAICIAGLGGPLYDPPQQRGITSLMATLLTRDTQRRTAQSVAEAIEQIGGSFQEFAGNNAFGLRLEILSEELPLGIELLQEALLRPTFNEHTFSIERDVQIAQIKEQQDDIMTYGQRWIRKQFFGTHPYALGALGDEESVTALTTAAVRAHYQRLVLGSNTVLAAAGDFDSQRLHSQLASFLESLPSRPFAPQHPPFSGPQDTDKFEITLPREQAVVFRAYPDVGIRESLFPVGEVMEEWFSGMSSRLYETIREDQAMSYFVGAHRLIGIPTSLFLFYAGTHPRHVPVVLEGIESEIERIKAGSLSEQALRRCRVHLKAQRRVSLQTMQARASHAALNTLYGLPANDERIYDQRIDAVTTEALQAFATKHFTPAQKVELIVRPK